MAISVTTVNTASDTFQIWVDKYNALSNAISTVVVTANNDANGSLTTGNAFVNGIFSSTTLAVPTLRGGNVQTANVLTISSNVTFTANLLQLANTVSINLGTFFANSIYIGGNTLTLSNRLSVGNSTVNVVITANSFTLAGTTLSNLNPRMAVANNGTLIGTRAKINFKPSNSIDLLLEDDAANDCINVTMINNTLPSIGGSNTHVQFADGTTFGGVSGFTFDKTTNTVFVGNNVILAKLEFSNGGRIRSFSNTITGTSSTTVESFEKADFRAADYVISIKDNNANNFQCAKFIVMHDGNNAIASEYGSMFNNTEIAVLNVWSNTTHVIINCTSTSTNTSVKGIRTTVAV